ncbi:MAG TPA: hypothetical protein VK176_11725, partial [Phycisphaerales bacterium]|nr:hypothetical protein [Phycisphaerales bacterium]
MNQPACQSITASHHAPISATGPIPRSIPADVMHMCNTPRRVWTTSAALVLLLCTAQVPGRQAPAAQSVPTPTPT